MDGPHFALDRAFKDRLSSTARRPLQSDASDTIVPRVLHDTRRDEAASAHGRGKQKIREAALDQTIEASFPASDPPSSNPNPDDDDAVDPGVQRTET